MPKRIQRKRTKGWRMPPGAVYAGRPGPYGNPYKIKDYLPNPLSIKGMEWPSRWSDKNIRRVLVEDFREYAEERLRREPDWLEPLRGKDLACWCAEDAEYCHVDVLLELANR